MSDLTQLYDEDFVRWTEVQAAALRGAARAGANLPLDWDNLAEEIEDLGKSLRRELNSRVALIIEHLMKLEFSPAADPRRGWAETIDHERDEIEELLSGNPSLRGDVADAVESGRRRAEKKVTRSFHRYGETTPALLAKLSGASYTTDQILGDWLPGEVGATAA